MDKRSLQSRKPLQRFEVRGMHEPLNKIRAQIADVIEKKSQAQRTKKRIVQELLRNFGNLGLRSSSMSDYVKELTIRDSIREEIKAEQSKVTISNVERRILGVAGIFHQEDHRKPSRQSRIPPRIDRVHIRISTTVRHGRNIVIPTNLR